MTHTLVVLGLMIASAQVPVNQPRCSTVWAVDFVQTRQGHHDDYLRYIDANWRAAREAMKAAGAVTSFMVLTQPPGTGDWNVMLMTEYPDQAAFDARERTYQEAVRRIRPGGAGPTLIDGKGARDLADIKYSRVLESRCPPVR